MWSLTRFNKFHVTQFQFDGTWRMINRVIKKSHNPFFEICHICQEYIKP